MIEVKKEQNGSELFVTLNGFLDTPAAGVLSEEMNGVYDGLTKLTFDFKDLEYLTSSGLRVILASQQAMDDNDGELIIKNVSEDIMEVFNLTGFSDVLTIE